MNPAIRQDLDGIHSPEREHQGAAYQRLLAAVRAPVDWAYEAWEELLAGLKSKDNRLRSIAAQLLCGLAEHSDPKARILKDFDAVLAVTRDEKFVTARHALQSLWRIGAAGKKQRAKLIEGLGTRFVECQAEKNCTLIRYDIIECMGRLHDAVGDEAIRRQALEWIATETDVKYRRKYEGVWKSRPKG